MKKRLQHKFLLPPIIPLLLLSLILAGWFSNRGPVSRFYRDGVIYHRGDEIWFTPLSGTNHTRLFPPETEQGNF